MLLYVHMCVCAYELFICFCIRTCVYHRARVEMGTRAPAHAMRLIIVSELFVRLAAIATRAAQSSNEARARVLALFKRGNSHLQTYTRLDKKLCVECEHCVR